jgi:hypothetical protein
MKYSLVARLHPGREPVQSLRSSTSYDHCYFKTIGKSMQAAKGAFGYCRNGIAQIDCVSVTVYSLHSFTA